MSTRVSVAMATYNGTKYLQAQLDSIARQTRLPDEVVIGDDGSSDNTVAILRDFAERAPFAVHVFANQTNLGFGRNFAKTIKLTSGDIVFLCDQDDIWDERKIETCVSAYQDPSRPVVVSHDAEIVDSDLRSTGLTLRSQLLREGRESMHDLVYGCCLTFDGIMREFFDLELCASHDSWLAEIARLLDSRLHLDAPLIRYRRHASTATMANTDSLKPTNKAGKFLHRLRTARRTDLPSELNQSIELTRSLLRAFERNESAVTTRFGPERLASVSRGLTARLARLEDRARIHTRRRLARPLPVARLLIKGGYSDASKLAAIRDLIA